MQGTRPCFLWKGRHTAGSTGIQGTRLEAGGFGTELWTCCRLYAPRLTFPLAAFNKVTNGSPALCAIRYCPSSNLQNQMKSVRVCWSQNPHTETCWSILRGFLPNEWYRGEQSLKKAEGDTCIVCRWVIDCVTFQHKHARGCQTWMYNYFIILHRAWSQVCSDNSSADVS